MKKTGSIIIVGISSDIGTAIARRYLNRGWAVFGTYRTGSHTTEGLQKLGAHLIHCDVARPASVHRALRTLRSLAVAWDVLVLAPATLTPIGAFQRVSFGDWEKSIRLNFLSHMGIIHGLLPRRSKSKKPCIISFSGGGTNNAPRNFSAYTVSKIATIKMFEILDAELNDARFVTIGPGWVRSKIHQETITAGRRAGDTYARTRKKLARGDFIPMERVLDCLDWVIGSAKKVVGGRDVHVVYDAWGSARFSKTLARDPELLKLRKI